MIKFELDVNQLEQLIGAAVDKAMKGHSIANGLPPLMNRAQVMEFLDIGTTKLTELFNREDFPVCRELGHPRVLTHLLIRWIEQHTDWIDENVGTRFKEVS